MNYLGIEVSKKEIKEQITNELHCNYGFIKHLTKWGQIQRLQDVYRKTNDQDEIHEIMDEIRQMYQDYCDAWGLDYTTDNR